MAAPRSGTVFVLAPTGRDAPLIAEALRRSGIDCDQLQSLEELVDRLDADSGAAVVGEEALGSHVAPPLQDWIDRQPLWSDFPVVVLTTGGESTLKSLRSFERLRSLGNVTLLERPVRTVTLVSAVQAALRARSRQHETRAYIAERVQAEEVLAEQAHQLAVSNADLQQFAYVTSHDLQEPLRTIHAYSQLLQRRYQGRFDPEADRFLRFIEDGALRMEGLIRDLLSYSRVINVQDTPFAPVPMDGVVRWCRENLQIAIAESGAVITAEALPAIPGDHVKLVQLIQNLLSNAIKYHRPGISPLIRLSAEQHGSMWLFRVSDNGQGIKPEYRDRIFGLFKRLHGKEIPGTGIGLAICRKIVEQHGGELSVESGENGAGATFCFTVRALAEEALLENPEPDNATAA